LPQRHDARAQHWLANFDPGGFALVMATGIVSIAARRLGHPVVGWTLLGVNLVAYPALAVIWLARLARFPRAVWMDFSRHDTGPNCLTAVAATGVLGSQFAAMGILPAVLPWLLGFAGLLWVVLVYGFLAAVTTAADKPAIEHGLNGTWLLLVVATEALTVLGCDVALRIGEPPALVFLCLACNLLGWMFYLLLMTLIFYRWVFMPMRAEAMTGPWWINMGAVAIATLAGARLMALPDLPPSLASLRDAAAPFTAMFWAAATFWLPLLALLFVWKHAVRRERLRYDWGQWAVVFPLGMYTTATEAYARVAGLPFLLTIPAVLFWLALLVWVLAFVGLLRAGWRRWCVAARG
jgi:tellurite resistance protein TehA-like permease